MLLPVARRIDQLKEIASQRAKRGKQAIATFEVQIGGGYGIELLAFYQPFLLAA